MVQAKRVKRNGTGKRIVQWVGKNSVCVCVCVCEGTGTAERVERNGAGREITQRNCA